MSQSDKSAPPTVIAIYRVQKTREDDFRALLRDHHPTLVQLGLATAQPPVVYRNEDGEGAPTYFEIFSWIDGQAPTTAHQTPEVARIWEAMGTMVEDRDGRPKFEFPHVEQLELSSSGSEQPAERAPGRDVGRELAELEAAFKALAHPARRQILLALHFRGGQTSAGEIARRFACSWPTTTRHLKVLREAGLVTVVQHGRERFYRVDKGHLRATVVDWLSWFDQDPAAGVPRDTDERT